MQLNDQRAPIAFWEKEIDEMVYGLYELTPNEIALIEKTF